ncbi:MAG: Cof-type HAD-IIB family hydrolase [Clostridia bacterium]|nr:Cof-type HAD-IIB family hydrolase [Clostridia bacterium]
MKYKLIIADFDGTLGNVPDYVHPDTIKAIKEYQSKGGIFAIITGRSHSSISEISEKYGFNCVVASFQGSRITDLNTGKTLVDVGIDPSRATEILLDLKELGFPLSFWSNDTLYYEQENQYTDMYEKKLSGKRFAKIDDFSNVKKQIEFPISKINLLEHPENVDKTAKMLQARYGNDVIVNSGAKSLIEIIDAKYSKGYAVKKIAEYYGIDLKEVLTVGDSTNDLQLIDGEWHGVAVGDAKEELKKVAKEITVPYSENPVKVLIEKYS